MKIRISYYALLIWLAFSLGNCSEKTTVVEHEKEKPEAKAECSPNVMCTKIFSTVLATITYKDKSPVELDSYKIIQTAMGTDKTPEVSPAELESYRKAGAYPITSDTYQKELANQELEVEFIGYKNNQELVKRKFTIGADCCHVKHIAGELEISIEK